MSEAPNILGQDILTDMAGSVLCWLATVAPDGTPNVTPKQIFAPGRAGGIVIADIASAGSVRNIRANPAVCVSFVDVFRQRGFKCVGRARIVARDAAEFPLLAADILRMAGGDYPVRHAIDVTVTRTERILAPSYRLFPGRSEAERMAITHATYGVKPAE